MLSRLLDAPVGDKDFTDDRLADLLYALGSASPEVREAIETDLGQQLVRAYRLPTEVGRADTTSVSVYHDRAETDEGLLRFGKSKDHRSDLRQYLQALGTLDPAGIPLVSETLNGNTEDPPIYLPVWRRMVKVTGALHRMCRAGDYVLTPLQMTGHMPEHVETWLSQQPKQLTTITLPDAQGSRRRVGCGYDVTHTVTWQNPRTDEEVTVPLRVFMVQRDRFKAQQIQDLQRRLTRAEAALKALNGRRYDTPAECTDLETQAQAVLVEHRVADYLSVQVRWQEQPVEKLVGSGRAGPQRRKQTLIYQVAQVSSRRKPAQIQAYEAAAGWRPYATNAPRSRLTVQQAVEKYYDGAPNKTTARPTTERLLSAFQDITLVQIRIGHEVQYQLSGFSKLQRRILQLLGLPASLYSALESSP